MSGSAATYLSPLPRAGATKAIRKVTVKVDCMTAGNESLTTAKAGFLEPLSILARQRESWSVALLPGLLMRALANMGTLHQVFQLLMLQPFAQAARANPRFAFKYLTHDYLVQGFKVAERAACFLHHYRRMHATLPDYLLQQILQGDVTVHTIPECGNQFSLSMGYSRAYDKEGELSINLLVDGDVVFLLSFTIVPGWVVKSQAAEALLITRIQGMKGCYNQVHLATRTMHDVAPAALLLAALQAIASAFGISGLAAVCAFRQSSYSKELAGTFKTAYDDFFVEPGLPKNTAGFFVTQIPIEGKPLSSIKQGHKLRTRDKRAFKLQIQSAVARFFAQDSVLTATRELPVEMQAPPVQCG